MTKEEYEERMNSMLEMLPPEIKEMVEKKKMVLEKEAHTYVDEINNTINAEAGEVLKRGLVEINSDNGKVASVISMALNEALHNKIEIRKLRKEISDIRKAHAAWISDSLNKD